MHYRIPNSICLGLVIAYILFALTRESYASIPGDIAVAAVLLGIGFGLFTINAFGAGDAKMLAAVGLWAGTSQVLNLIVIMSLAGGVLAVIVSTKLFISKKTSTTTIRHHPLPYGVAITCGAIPTFYPYLAPTASWLSTNGVL